MRPIDQIENNSVICFLGDSITANGIWENEVFHYLLSDYKEKHLKLYNCGIGGDRSMRCLKRVYRDCLSFHPDYVVLMLGMNDINVTLYKEDSEENRIARQECIDAYFKNMTEIMDIITSNHVKLILCTPTICGCVPNNMPEIGDFTPGLETCAHFIREQAALRGCTLIDFNTELWNYTTLQEPIISEDCVHPTAYGYHIMAQVFMQQMGMRDDVDLAPYIETDEKSKARLQVEAILTNIRFCELAMQWCGIDPPTLTIEERKNWIQENATPENGRTYWTPEVIDGYLNTVDFKDTYTAKLVELTNAMYLDR